MSRTALYPGSFDPPTLGHLDLIGRAARLADRLVVAIAVNPAKQPLFSTEERLDLLRQTIGPDPRIAVESFEGLLAEYAQRIGASFLIRGLRAAGDLEFELQMATMNRQLAQGLETLFLAPAAGLTYVSASLVREVARFGGDVRQLVHPAVAAALARRFAPPR
jgi:pantetheine-phosphate adenylyltransferase